MPAATEPFTSAGTTIAIALDKKPATFNAVGYAAATMQYKTIGEVTDAGSFGREYSQVTHTALADRKVLKRKGSFNEGQMTLQMARLTNDVGQADLIKARDSDKDSSFKVTLQDGTILYFGAQVMSYTTEIGSTDQITASTAQLELTQNIVQVAPA